MLKFLVAKSENVVVWIVLSALKIPTNLGFTWFFNWLNCNFWWSNWHPKADEGGCSGCWKVGSHWGTAAGSGQPWENHGNIRVLICFNGVSRENHGTQFYGIWTSCVTLPNCEKTDRTCNEKWPMYIDDLPLKHDDFQYAKLPEGRKSFATCD